MIKLLLSFLLLISGCVSGNDAAFATVGTNLTKVMFAGDGVSTSFNFGSGGYSVPVYLSTDIQVYVKTNSTGAIQQLTLNTNYTVTLTQVPYSLTNTVVYYTAVINLAGGSSPWGALQSGTTLILNRSIPYTNLLNITDYSATPASTYNQGYDRATMLSQQLYTLSQQGVLQPVSATTPITVPTAENGYILCWSGTTLSNCANNGTGTPIPIPIPNGDLATLTTAGLVNTSSISGSALATTYGGTGTSANANAANGAVVLNSSANLIAPGNIGVGSVNPGQSLDVVGTVRATSFTGQSGHGLLGLWASYTCETSAHGNTQLAATDLFITGYSTANANTAQCITDSNSSPTTIRNLNNSGPNAGEIGCSSFVRKGDYYEILVTNNGENGICYTIPLGS